VHQKCGRTKFNPALKEKRTHLQCPSRAGQEVGTSLGLLNLEEIGSYNFRYTGNIGV
jgi:hypothetical protein